MSPFTRRGTAYSMNECNNHWAKLLLVGSFLRAKSWDRDLPMCCLISFTNNPGMWVILLALFWSWENMLREVKQWDKDLISKWLIPTWDVLAPLFFPSCHFISPSADTAPLYYYAPGHSLSPKCQPLVCHITTSMRSLLPTPPVLPPPSSIPPVLPPPLLQSSLYFEFLHPFPPLSSNLATCYTLIM